MRVTSIHFFCQSKIMKLAPRHKWSKMALANASLCHFALFAIYATPARKLWPFFVLAIATTFVCHVLHYYIIYVIKEGRIKKSPQAMETRCQSRQSKFACLSQALSVHTL